MSWLTITGLGAIGGAIVSLVAFASDVLSWQRGRRVARTNRRRRRMPSLAEFVDPRADLAALLTRLVLGGLAGGIFHSQVSGVQAAVAVGAAAPALLSQLGSAREFGVSPGGEAAEPALAASIPVTDMPPQPSKEV